MFGDKVDIIRLYPNEDQIGMDVEVEAIDFYLIPKTIQFFNAEDLAFYNIKDEKMPTIKL